MIAVRLNKPGQSLEIEEVPEPTPGPNGVKVKVLSAAVPSFTDTVMSGKLPIPLPIPYTPGPSCVGVVEEMADDVHGISVGQEVFCSPYYSVRVNGRTPEEILIGWFGLTPESGPLMERWKNGAFAQKAVYPLECVTPLDPGRGKDWIKLAPLSIAYGALLRGSFEPGQSVLITGATGNLGSAAVFLALGLGASRVYVAGRDAKSLASITSLDKRRVVPIELEGTPVDYGNRITAVAAGVDLLVDALGYATTPEITSAGLSSLKNGGTCVFMGGVLVEIPVSYFDVLGKQLTIRGSFMHPASAPSVLARLVNAQILDLDKIAARFFALDEIARAVSTAADSRGLTCCALTP